MILFSEGRLILTVNGGSSSIKFAVFTEKLSRLLSGQLIRIGQSGTTLIVKEDSQSSLKRQEIERADFSTAVCELTQYLQERLGRAAIAGIGHRIVHGGAKLIDNQVITLEVIAELRTIAPIDLMHLPREIDLIEALGKSFPGIPQVACFDTAFHRDLPRTAAMLPIPRRYFDAGVRRFGFHGLSYIYLMRQLGKIAGAAPVNGRIILAHLGSGSSMAAVRDGKPIDTTMAFTPTAGLVMGTRPGDLDPGVLVYLMRSEKWTPDQMDDFISNRCGLLGVSETSADMQDLLKSRNTDQRAAEAVDLFCYQARKFVGALAATMGGLDTLIFSGGIGEHSPEVRDGICAGLSFLSIRIDPVRNSANSAVISSDDSRVTVRVMPTDEELVIAEAVRSQLQ